MSPRAKRRVTTILVALVEVAALVFWRHEIRNAYCTAYLAMWESATDGKTPPPRCRMPQVRAVDGGRS